MENHLPKDAIAARAAAREHPSFVLGFPNAFGCGVGRRTVGGRETDEWCLVVFVTRKLPREALRTDELIPRELKTSEGVVMTDIVERAEPRFGADTNQYRPLLGGCQIGSAGGAGTLGGIVYDATDDEPVLLTCNHVLTMAGQRSTIPANPTITQPASNTPFIGTTKRIIPWLRTPLGAAYAALEAWVDAGIVRPTSDVDVRFRVIDLGTHPYVILPPFPGLDVLKRGATTETTSGTVKEISITIVLPDSNGQKIRIGGVDSVFSVQAAPDVLFSSPGDSGSLVVDADRGAVRGMFFGGDMRAGGISYVCEMRSIFEALQLETPCMGGVHALVRRAIRRRSLEARPVSNVGLAHDLIRNVDKFRHKYLSDSRDGMISGAFGSMLQRLAPQLAEEIHADGDFAGLMDAAFGAWLLSPTVYDLLEYPLPDDFERRVRRAFDHLRQCRPEVAPQVDWLSGAFANSGGLRMRELLHRPVSGADAATAVAKD